MAEDEIIPRKEVDRRAFRIEMARELSTALKAHRTKLLEMSAVGRHDR
jgi:hypothetical protein